MHALVRFSQYTSTLQRFLIIFSKNKKNLNTTIEYQKKKR